MSTYYDEGPVMFPAQPVRFTATVLVIAGSLAATFTVNWLYYPGLILAGLAALTLLWWYLDNHFTRIVVGEDHVSHKRGVFSRSHVELDRRSIRTVRVDQTVIDRIFGCGKLIVISAGDKADIDQDGLPAVSRLRTALRSSSLG